MENEAIDYQKKMIESQKMREELKVKQKVDIEDKIIKRREE